ncbi:restriction endonuclease subunit S [Allochromatium tepidum]|uniref:restriction endonuclease subunit S n=1 Tax=Allochromatium tepidum TaxID=553982 RepID=UPI001BCCACE4|nr:restriction endonuclease subunit S [Allochromatium tepidum]
MTDTYPKKQLGDVVEFLDSMRRPVTESDRRAGEYPYYGANGLQGTIDDFIFDEPLLLLAEDGGHFGSPDRGIAYRVSGKTWVNNHAHVLRPKACVDLGFLCRVLENYDVTPWVTGTTRGKLTQAGAAQIVVPLPPLPEQRRIAEILDKADALRAKRRAALAQLDTLTQSIFLDMFGDPATNPKGWPKKPFGEVCETRLGKMLDQKQQTGQNRRPYLRNANVQWFRFDITNLLEMDFDEDERRILRLQPGDLLICEGGEPGRAAVWQGEIEECYFQKALHRARPDRRLAAPDYLAWLLWFLVKRGGLSGVTSATIAHLTGEKLAVLPTMLPPVDLQRLFVCRVAGIKTLATNQRASLHQLDALFASLQHRAFRGEL